MKRTRLNYPIAFVSLGLAALVLTLLVGIFGSMVYLYPESFKELLAFNQMRPLHVSNAIAWIVLTATGGIYFYQSRNKDWKWRFPILIKLHFWLFLIIGLLIWFSYLSGNMGGREYLVFAPLLMIPVLFGWLLFGINYVPSLLKTVRNWPVYYWMWLIGICFMVYHLCEANFWNIDHFRSNFIRDKMVQWKSYGSFVGSWNMLVYGTAMFLMAKIAGDDSSARGRKVFFFFFLGLANLMFGWAHHTYTLPTLPWVRYVAYATSMTEWILFANIIYDWNKSFKQKGVKPKGWAYRFLLAADFWVFLNLFLALLMSIPAINFFTHGTHVTVAHSMGTTIGINTSILLASVCYIQSVVAKNAMDSKWFKVLFFLFNGALLIFWLALIGAGWFKSKWQHGANDLSFGEMQEASNPYFVVFVISGAIMVLAVLPLAGRLLRDLVRDGLFIKESTSSDS